MPVYDTYLAANTPQGFVSRFSELGRERLQRLYILKGSSGNGKSTFLRNVAAPLADMGEETEYIHCSADSRSLDGVVFPGLRVALVDGTAPHVVEPRWPFAFEQVVELYDAIRPEVVRERREEVFRAAEENRSLLERASRLISAAGALETDAMRLRDACVDQRKLKQASLRLGRKLFGKLAAEPGAEEQRFLTAIGGESFWNAVTSRADVLYVLDDDVGAARHFLAALRGMGRAAGQRTVSFWCPMRPADRVEHLLFPEAGVGFVTSNGFHRISAPEARHINCRRFTDTAALREHASRLTFDRRTARELLHGAEEALRQAKQAHDRLETVYVSALDEAVLRRKEQALLAELMELRPGSGEKSVPR